MAPYGQSPQPESAVDQKDSSNSKQARNAFIVACIAPLTCGLAGPVAMYLGLQARQRFAGSSVAPRNGWMATAALALGGVSTLLLVVLIVAKVGSGKHPVTQTAATVADAASPDTNLRLGPPVLAITAVSPTETKLSIGISGSAEDGFSTFVNGIPTWCAQVFSNIAISRCTLSADGQLDDDVEDADGAVAGTHVQASVERSNLAALAAPAIKAADIGKLLVAVDVPKRRMAAWRFVTDSFPTDQERARYVAAKAKSAAAEDLHDRAEALVQSAKATLKSFEHGQLVALQEDDESEIPIDTSLSTLREIAKSGFTDIKELQSITVVETGAFRNKNGVMQPSRKIAEVRVSRLRAATIDWENIKDKNLINAIDSAWHIPEAPFVIVD